MDILVSFVNQRFTPEWKLGLLETGTGDFRRVVEVMAEVGPGTTGLHMKSIAYFDGEKYVTGFGQCEQDGMWSENECGFVDKSRGRLPSPLIDAKQQYFHELRVDGRHGECSGSESQVGSTRRMLVAGETSSLVSKSDNLSCALGTQKRGSCIGR